MTGAPTGPLAVSVVSDLISRVTDAVLEEVPEVAEPTGSDAGAIIAAARAGSTGGRQGEEVGFATDSPVEGDGFEPSVPRLRRNSARLAGRDATRVRNTIVRVDQLEREKAGRSHRLQAASTSSTSIDSPEHGVPGAVFGRDADLDSHPPLRAQSCDPAMVHQHLEPNFILVESASPR